MITVTTVNIRDIHLIFYEPLCDDILEWFKIIDETYKINTFECLGTDDLKTIFTKSVNNLEDFIDYLECQAIVLKADKIKMKINGKIETVQRHDAITLCGPITLNGPITLDSGILKSYDYPDSTDNIKSYDSVSQYANIDSSKEIDEIKQYNIIRCNTLSLTVIIEIDEIKKYNIIRCDTLSLTVIIYDTANLCKKLCKKYNSHFTLIGSLYIRDPCIVKKMYELFDNKNIPIETNQDTSYVRTSRYNGEIDKKFNAFKMIFDRELKIDVMTSKLSSHISLFYIISDDNLIKDSDVFDYCKYSIRDMSFITFKEIMKELKIKSNNNEEYFLIRKNPNEIKIALKEIPEYKIRTMEELLKERDLTC